MDRIAALTAAYDEALAAGTELLDLLRAPTSEDQVERTRQLIARRDAAVREAVARFQPGDQEMLRDRLEALVAQQKELESEVGRWIADLRCRLQEVEDARTAARRSLRLMDPGNRGSLLDQRS